MNSHLWAGGACDLQHGHLCQEKRSCVVPPETTGQEKPGSREGSDMALLQLLLVLQC